MHKDTLAHNISPYPNIQICWSHLSPNHPTEYQNRPKNAILGGGGGENIKLSGKIQQFLCTISDHIGVTWWAHNFDLYSQVYPTTQTGATVLHSSLCTSHSALTPHSTHLVHSPLTHALTPCPLHSTPAALLAQVDAMKSAVTHFWLIHTYKQSSPTQLQHKTNSCCVNPHHKRMHLV